MDKTMKQKKGIFQKISLFSAKFSFVIALLCGITLYIKVEEIGYQSPISASLLGSLFFFLFVGGLLTIVGNSDIPSFRFDSADKEER